MRYCRLDVVLSYPDTSCYPALTRNHLQFPQELENSWHRPCCHPPTKTLSYTPTPWMLGSRPQVFLAFSTTRSIDGVEVIPSKFGHLIYPEILKTLSPYFSLNAPKPQDYFLNNSLRRYLHQCQVLVHLREVLCWSNAQYHPTLNWKVYRNSD